MTCTRLPDARRDATTRKVDANRQRFAINHRRRDGKVGEIRVRIRDDLIAGGVDGLRKKALPIQKSDANQGHPRVACGLAMIAGKDAKAAGINRQAFMETEFRAKICNPVVLPPAAGADAHISVGVVIVI
jgi:hypothetical protein